LQEFKFWAGIKGKIEVMVCLSLIYLLVLGAYPEIFRGEGLYFLYGREYLEGGFGIFFLKNPRKLKKKSK